MRYQRWQWVAGAACALAMHVGVARGQLLTPTIGVGAGPGFPIDNSSSVLGSGSNVRAFVGLDLGPVPIGLRMDASFDHLPTKQLSGHQNLWSITENGLAEWRLPVAQPYLIWGVGYYYSDFLNESSSHFGVNGGFGVRVRLPAGFSIFGETRWHEVFGGRHDISYAPLTFGVQL